MQPNGVLQVQQGEAGVTFLVVMVDTIMSVGHHKGAEGLIMTPVIGDLAESASQTMMMMFLSGPKTILKKIKALLTQRVFLCQQKRIKTETQDMISQEIKEEMRGNPGLILTAPENLLAQEELHMYHLKLATQLRMGILKENLLMITAPHRSLEEEIT